MVNDVDCSGHELGLSNEETNDWTDYNVVLHACIIILKKSANEQPSYVILVLLFIMNIVLARKLKRSLRFVIH